MNGLPYIKACKSQISKSICCQSTPCLWTFNMITLCNHVPIFYFWHCHTRNSIHVDQSILFRIYLFLARGPNTYQGWIMGFQSFWAGNVEEGSFKSWVRFFASPDIWDWHFFCWESNLLLDVTLQIKNERTCMVNFQRKLAFTQGKTIVWYRSVFGLSCTRFITSNPITILLLIIQIWKNEYSNFRFPVPISLQPVDHL